MSTDNQFMDYIELGGMVNEETEVWDGQGGGGPVPGEYEFEILEAKQEVSKKGKPCLNVKFQVVSEGEEKGKSCRGWYYMTEKAIGRLMSLLLAAGVPLDDRNGFSASALIGTRIIASIVENTYKGDPNPITQVVETKTNTRIQQERAVPKAAAKAGAKPGAPIGAKPGSAVPRQAQR